MLPAPAQTNVGNAYNNGYNNGGGSGYNYGLGSGGAAIGGGLGQLFANWFGGNSNPADAASPYLNQIPDAMKQYLNPYMKAGQGAMGELQGQYGNLLNDPSGMLANFGKNFQQDPGYQFQLKQGEQGITNAAAAGGMAGTPMHQEQAANYSQGLANSTYQDYLHNVMGLYGQGLQGEEGINQMGYGASNNMAQGLAQALMAQANNAYAGQANQNQSQSGGLGSLFGGLGSLAGLL